MKQRNNKQETVICDKDGYQSGGPNLSQVRSQSEAGCLVMDKALRFEQSTSKRQEPSKDTPTKTKNSDLSARKRREACEALDILKGTGWSLPAAARLVVDELESRKSRNTSEPNFLTTFEAYQIMETARATPYAAGLALMLFAGLPNDEISGSNTPPLTWNDIDFTAKQIRIPAAISKTRKLRIIDKISKNLWRWLEYCRQKNTPILPCSSRQAQRFAAAQLERPWPKNAFSNSFATYHLALNKDSHATALSLGFTGLPSTLDKRYLGQTKLQIALDYFDIYPEIPDIVE